VSLQKPISSSTLRTFPAVPLLELTKLCRMAVYISLLGCSPLSLTSTLHMFMTSSKWPFAPSPRTCS
jgi:hypothetical protein